MVTRTGKGATPRTAGARIAALAAAGLVMAACSSGGNGGDDGGDGGNDGGDGGSGGATEFEYLTINENMQIADILTTLGSDQCAEANEALPLVVDTVPQSNLDQQLQLLAGQDALPVQFAAGGSPATTMELDENGQLLDLTEAMTELGVIDSIEPGAISSITALYGSFNVLPYQYNVEGIWYNKQLFADNGIEVPTTWDALVAAADTLSAAGVTPFAASGEQGWPITRLISGYLFRDLGPDALQAVADGEASLSDPEYVAAAQAIADLGAAGYFGEGVGSIDYATAVSQFLTGQAGMMYMGSWVLADINADTNEVGAENIGFMKFPEVAGGAGSLEQMPANVGLPMALSQSLYDDNVGAWLACIAENYGSQAMADQAAITGFKLNTPVDNIPPITQELQGIISEATETVLWFEALMGPQAQTTAQSNAAPLVSGSITAEEFMALVQADLDAE